jgi:glucose/arabinose dehydrogenase
LEAFVKPCIVTLSLTSFLLLSAATVGAQQDTVTSPAPWDQPTALPDTPQVFRGDGQPYRVVPIKGLANPWALAVLPNGDILVTERVGRLRIIRKGVLDPQPISGLPEINTGATNAGLMDIALHPRYAENKLVYFTYSKPKPGNPYDDIRWSGNQKMRGSRRDAATATLARARYDGGASLGDVKDIFVADAWSQGTSGARIAFTLDGKIIMTVGMPIRHEIGTADDAQNPANHAGKILRLNDDGSAPSDNPFVGKPGYKPEIFALGIRNALGLFVHPETGEIYETENGPMGGDELNIVKAGRNYGWPVVSYGMDYSGNQIGGGSGTTSDDRKRPGMEDPFIFWNPSPAVAGVVVYTGNRFPLWKGNIFVGAMGGKHLGARQLHRIVLSRTGRPQRGGNMTMLAELNQRIRDVKQGPDGLLYLTTDEKDGAVLRIEPVENKTN